MCLCVYVSVCVCVCVWEGGGGGGGREREGMYTYVSMETMTTAETAGVMIVHVLIADDTRTLIIILHRGGEEDRGNCHRG